MKTLDYINDTLVHWTGRAKDDDSAFEILKSIVTKQLLWLTKAPNFGSTIRDKETMMVCFTDIPLRFSEKHCSLFGKFGVGFNKNKFIEYGANPVLYLTSTHNSRISEVNTLINRLLGENIDREWREQVDRYQFTEDQLYSLFELFSFSQEYKYNDNHINYYQREWRIGYETLTPKIGGDPTIPGQSGIRGIVNGKMRCEMKFAPEDIDYIILPKSHYKRKNEILDIVDCKVKIYEVEVERKWWKKF
ncbi:MAG: abortive infection system antitoxin AbiGi family protein [Tenuifilaceae bacterium]|jgi:hypothetical protein